MDHRPTGDDAIGEASIDIVRGIAANVAATVESSSHDVVRSGTQRCDWRGCCTVTGDEAYAALVLDTLNIV